MDLLQGLSSRRLGFKALLLEKQHVLEQFVPPPPYVGSALLPTPCAADCAFASANPSSTCPLCAQDGCILQLYSSRISKQQETDLQMERSFQL